MFRGRISSCVLLAATMLAPASVRARADDVTLDWPESVELKVVVDYAATTLGLNVIYDEGQLTKRVSLRVAGPVPRADLAGLLRTVLLSRGLALVPAEQPGWDKIVPLDQLTSESATLSRDLPPPEAGAADVLTYVLPLRHADPETVRTALSPYLSKVGGTVLVAAESRLLVITDVLGKVRRAVELAQLLDVPTAAAEIATIPVQHQDATDLAATVTALLAAQTRVDTRAKAAAPLTLQADPLSGGLIAIGAADQIGQARELVRRFDQPVARRTELYQPRYLTAGRLRTLIEQLLPGAGLKTALDEPSNTLVVTARADVQTRVAELLTRFDTAPPESATPLRFYKLLNRRAADVFATIGTLLVGEAFGADPSTHEEAGPHTTGGGLQIPPRPPAAEGRGAGERAAPAALQGADFALSLDEHTNAIIAIAPPELHRQLEQLVAQLDKRRPQVLVEVTLVSISLEDGLDLGVELQTQKLGKPWSFELFTSFGLSELDPTLGTRSLNVLPGGTGVLLAPDEVPLIIQALARSGKTRVYSAPRILVDDNAVGTIESVAESPYSSVNASNTVATTSFAGFAKAGTQLTIEPHIAEGDHLEIKYALTVSSFTGSGSAAAPPPRSSDMITSTIRVPDAHTVVVGGLLTETLGESSSHVPLLGDVPVLGLLFGTNGQSKSKVRLYAFIRPTILRHESFEDLKYLSRSSMRTAGVDDDYPPDRWQVMH